MAKFLRISTTVSYFDGETGETIGSRAGASGTCTEEAASIEPIISKLTTETIKSALQLLQNGNK